MTSLVAAFRQAAWDYADSDFVSNHLYRFNAVGRRILISEKRFKNYELMRRIPKYVSRRLTVESERNGCTIVRQGTCPPKSDFLELVESDWAKSKLKIGGLLVAEMYLAEDMQMAGDSTHVSREWLSVVGPSGIPYSKASRPSI